MAGNDERVNLLISALVDGLENVAALSGELKELEKSGKEQVPDNTKDLRDGADKTTSVMESLRANIGKVVAAGAALGGVAATLKSVSSEAAEYETRMKKLEAVVEATGGAAGYTADEIRSMSQELALATLGSVEEFENASSVLLTFKSITGDAFGQALELSKDLAEVMGGDAVSAARQLGRALEDPEQGLTALRRSGVSFTEAQKEVIKSLVDTGNVAAAQKIILEQIGAQVGGVAKSMADGTLDGALDTLGQRFEELKVASGEAINPQLIEITNTLVAVLEGMAAHLDEIKTGAEIVGAVALTAFAVKMAGAVKTANISLLTMSATLTAMPAKINAATAAMTRLQKAISIVGAAWVGWEIGTHLKEEFVEIERAGIALAAGLTKMAERAKFAFEVLNTKVDSHTLDNISDAYDRLQVRLDEIDSTYAEMFANAGRVNKAVKDLDGLLSHLGIDTEKYRSGLTTIERNTIDAFSSIAKNANATGDQITDAFVISLDRIGLDALPKLTAGLQKAMDDGKISVEQFQEASEKAAAAFQDKFSKALDTVSTKEGLLELQEKIKGLKEAGTIGAEGANAALEKIRHKLEQLADKSAEAVAKLNADLKEIGLDPEKYRSGLTTIERETVDTFNRIAKNTEATGDQIADAFVQSLDKIGIDALPDLAAGLQQAMDDGKISVEQFQKASEQAADAFKAKFSEALNTVSTKDGLLKLQEQIKGLKDAGEIGAEGANAALESIRQKMLQLDSANVDLGVNIRQGMDGIQQGGEQAEEKVTSLSQTLNNSSQGAQEFKEKWQAAWGGAFGQALTNARESVSALSTAARNLFEMKIGGNQFVSEAESASDALEKARQRTDELASARRSLMSSSLGAWFADTALAAAEVEEQFWAQAVAMENLQNQIESGTYSLDQLNRLSTTAANKFDLLDDQRLSGLQSAIDSARSKLESLNASADSTLNSLQQKLAEIRGDTEEAARLEYESEREQLVKELEAARQAGADAAAADYQKALNTLDQIYKIEKQNRAEEAAAAAKAAAEREKELELAEMQNRAASTSFSSQSSASTQPVKTVNVNLGGETFSVLADDESTFLKALSAARRTAQ